MTLGSVILIPDFYCMDVVINIKNHGFNPVYYPMDDNFQVELPILNAHISAYTPAAIILFDACGIPCLRMSEMKKLTRNNPNIIFIQDAVHRLIEPNKVRLVAHNHYLIDSLRKVSPLPGSNIYWKTGSQTISPDTNRNEWCYRLSVHVWYVFFRVLLTTATLMRIPRLILYAHEKTLKSHDDIVGDSTGGYAGNPLTPHILTHSHFAKVQKHKRHQVELYEKLLRNVCQNNFQWFPVTIPDKAKQELHVYPLGFRHNGDMEQLKKIENLLHRQHILVWFKFPEAPWSDKRSVLFLPLGFHIRNKDIFFIAQTLKEIISREA